MDLQQQIAQFRKMANDDPTNELGHYRLGQLLLDAGQPEEAVASFQRTIELEPYFSKAFQLLGKALVQLGRRDEALKVLRDGYTLANERGDTLPRDEMGKLLVQLGETPPEPKTKAPAPPPGPGGFHCQRPGCTAGGHARQLAKPPMNDEIGRKIYEQVCADCWEYWFRNLSIKVINEMRLDLSTEQGIEVYDQIMRETLGVS